MRRWVRVCIFLSSYSPLFGILLLRIAALLSSARMERTTYALFTSWPYVCLWTTSCLAIFPGIVVRLLLHRARSYSGKTICVEGGQSRASDVLSYVIGYVIPFLDLDTGSIWDMSAVGLLLLTMCVVYVNSDLIYINPFLSLLGYSTYRVQTQDDVAVMVLTKKRKADFGAMRLTLVEVSEGVFLEV
jgi:hypothetical protein